MGVSKLPVAGCHTVTHMKLKISIRELDLSYECNQDLASGWICYREIRYEGEMWSDLTIAQEFGRWEASF